MLRFLMQCFLLCWALRAISALAADAQVLKVLPQFLDSKGRHTLSPSLYDRDAYQAQLRQHPGQRSGMRFVVQWRGGVEAGKQLMLRVELRGMAKGELPRSKVLKAEVDARSRGSRWTVLKLTGEEYKTLGEVTAWRVTLLDGEMVLGEQQSFLW